MRFASTLAALALLAASARADIAVFTGGRTMKVSAYQVHEQSMDLTLASGGRMTVPLQRIERIVDDEVAPPAVVAEVKKEGGEFPKRSWHFDENSGPKFNSKYDKLIIKAAKHFDVDAGLVSAVIKAESDYDSRTVSNKGAQGLMQLMPATASRFGVTNAFDPEANIYGGTRYLRWLLEKFEGNADYAVAAYNAGEGNVWKYDGIPPFRETINYVKRIAKHFREKTAPVAVTASSSSTR
jgi:membrane-bound lytic murein transglycosylase B